MIRAIGQTLRKSSRSFGPAFRGFAFLLRNENNARLHLVATVLVLIAGFHYRVSTLEWCVLTTQIGLVWAAEAFNTAIERAVDYISLDRNRKAAVIKDLAAAAVLVLSLSAVVSAGLIFLPRIHG
jgi:diacylglycerol kinase